MTAVADVHVCDITDDIIGDITADRKRKRDNYASDRDNYASDPDRTISAKNVRCGNISFGVLSSEIRNWKYFYFWIEMNRFKDFFICQLKCNNDKTWKFRKLNCQQDILVVFN